MKIKGLKGGPEDLIRRCDDCDYCIFEDILTDEQRKIKVLDLEIPKNHAHRASLEYVCGENHDGVCVMKYAAMRGIASDEVACQLGSVKDFMWDLGKKYNRPVRYPEAIPEWTKSQELGRDKLESFAERFREVYNLGLREINKNGNGEVIIRQNLTSPGIYEVVIASPWVYDSSIKDLTALKKESEERAKL